MKLITPREDDVLKLIGEGFSTRRIADLLNISINTVQTHRRSLLKKFNAANSAQLIQKSMLHGLKGSSGWYENEQI